MFRKLTEKIRIFIVDTTRPGVALGMILQNLVYRVYQNSVTFDQVILPEDSLLGLTLKWGNSVK